MLLGLSWIEVLGKLITARDLVILNFWDTNRALRGYSSRYSMSQTTACVKQSCGVQRLHCLEEWTLDVRRQSASPTWLKCTIVGEYYRQVTGSTGRLSYLIGSWDTEGMILFALADPWLVLRHRLTLPVPLPYFQKVFSCSLVSAAFSLFWVFWKLQKVESRTGLDNQEGKKQTLCSVHLCFSSFAVLEVSSPLPIWACLCVNFSSDREQNLVINRNWLSPRSL